MKHEQAQILWDYVLHWNKSRTNAVNILDKLNLTVYKTSMSDVLAAENGVQLLDVKIKALQRYRNNNSVLVCDNEVESIENISQVISFVTYQLYQFSGIHASIARYITFGKHRLYHIQCNDIVVYGHHTIIAFRVYRFILALA